MRPHTRWISLALLLTTTTTTTTSFALPPNAAPGLRPGANHHTGDDGFVADLGREPTPGEEKLRMHEHFVAVRARLAALPATRPDLEGKRHQLLAALDTYIGQGVTPDNDVLPWRTPVFIDDKGVICAVGFLIQQSAGRPLAEKVAAAHRYSFIEDIAKDMPEVRAWVAESGFTLDELGQIQPGYQGPEVMQFHPFDLAKHRTGDDESADAPHVDDGPYDHDGMTGAIEKRLMEGPWELSNAAGIVLGSGTFHHGAGTWTSFYADGAKMAEGAFAHNRPSGTWKFFHGTGYLAAEGRFQAGQRTGTWKFYYDTAAQTPIAIGAFTPSGYVTGTWKHFASTGKLLLTSSTDEVPAQWEEYHPLFWSAAYRLQLQPRDGITHRIHTGTISGDSHRLDELATTDGRERAYLRYDDNTLFDTAGHKLVSVDGTWRADDCKWSAARRRAAKSGDIAALHGLIYKATDEVCAQGELVAPDRAARLTRLAGSLTTVRAASPELLEKVALGDQAAAASLTDTLAANMSLDIEWPHVDGKFVALFETLPGYTRS